VSSNASGVATHIVNLQAPNSLITGAGVWNFQFWYRDPAGGPAGFNLSDAIQVNFCD